MVVNEARNRAASQGKELDMLEANEIERMLITANLKYLRKQQGQEDFVNGMVARYFEPIMVADNMEPVQNERK